MGWKIPSNTLYEPSITLMPKPDRDITRKENYRTLISYEHRCKILKKKQTEYLKHIKMVIYKHIKMVIYNQVIYIPGVQEWFNIQKSIKVIHHINRVKEKNPHNYQYMQEKCCTISNTLS